MFLSQSIFDFWTSVYVCCLSFCLLRLILWFNIYIACLLSTERDILPKMTDLSSLNHHCFKTWHGILNMQHTFINCYSNIKFLFFNSVGYFGIYYCLWFEICMFVWSFWYRIWHIPDNRSVLLSLISHCFRTWYQYLIIQHSCILLWCCIGHSDRILLNVLPCVVVILCLLSIRM